VLDLFAYLSIVLYVCACMLYYCNTVRWAWWDWELSVEQLACNG